MAHTNRYSFRGVSRLAADAGLSKSTVSHLVHGKVNPLYITVAKLVKYLEIESGEKLDFTEVFSSYGTYPTEFVCTLLKCPGCLPDIAFTKDGDRKDSLKDVNPGNWTGDTAEFLGKETDATR